MYSKAGCAASKTFITTMVVPRPMTYPLYALDTQRTLSAQKVYSNCCVGVAIVLQSCVVFNSLSGVLRYLLDTYCNASLNVSW